jgi:hypothetical protein
VQTGYLEKLCFDSSRIRAPNIKTWFGRIYIFTNTTCWGQGGG